MKNSARTAVLLALLEALSPGLVRAQAVATPVIVPRAADLAPAPQRPISDPALLPQRAPLRELQKPEDEILIDVTGFAVPDDAAPRLKEALAGLTAPYVGKGKTWEDLVNAKDAVTRFMQSQMGFYLGYAYIPEQAPVDGVIQLAVLEGRLDRVRLVWDDDQIVDRAVVEAYLAQLQPGSILTVSQVERVVFLINDLRGIFASFEIEPGSMPGTANLVVRPKRESRMAYKVDVDVNGSRFIGLARMGAQATIGSPFGMGDSASLSALSSLTGGMQFVLAGYSSPLGGSGLRAGGAVSAVSYELDKEEFPIGRHGTALNANIFGLYPAVRSRNLNLFTLLSYDEKHYDDREEASASSTKKNVRSLTVAANGDTRDSLLTGGVNSYDIGVSAGRVSYADGPPSGLSDAPDYTKLTLSLSRLQNLVTGRLLAYLSLRGQYSFNNLDTTEQFRLGGPDGVRAFANGEGTGDSGVIATAELRAPLTSFFSGQIAQEAVLALFADFGHIQFRRDPANRAGAAEQSNSARYSGAGIGLAWVRAGQYALRISIASPIKGEPKGDTVVRDPRVYAQFSAYF
ncbi:MAG: ShlB/FhaC/HecB family hemolysin secretion/activation protein [Paucibacter sp.]|nr:ShlB/FhaC/HecB family hemolysin secretion/activation protein [Roseateles sp.]